jgi:hypothetical protein
VALEVWKGWTGLVELLRAEEVVDWVRAVAVENGGEGCSARLVRRGRRENRLRDIAAE